MKNREIARHIKVNTTPLEIEFCTGNAERRRMVLTHHGLAKPVPNSGKSDWQNQHPFQPRHFPVDHRTEGKEQAKQHHANRPGANCEFAPDSGGDGNRGRPGCGIVNVGCARTSSCRGECRAPSRPGSLGRKATTQKPSAKESPGQSESSDTPAEEPGKRAAAEPDDRRMYLERDSGPPRSIHYAEPWSRRLIVEMAAQNPLRSCGLRPGMEIAVIGIRGVRLARGRFSLVIAGQGADNLNGSQR